MEINYLRMNRQGDFRPLVFFVLIVGGMILGYGAIATQFAAEYGIETNSSYQQTYNYIENITDIHEAAQDSIEGAAVQSGTYEDNLIRSSYRVVKNVLFGLPSFYWGIITNLATDFGAPVWATSILLAIAIITIIYYTISWVMGRVI